MLLLLCVVLFLFLYVQHRYMLKKPLKLCGLLPVFKLWWLHHKKLAASFHFPIPYYILVSCIFHLFGSHTIVVEFWAWLPFIQRWLHNFDKAFRFFHMMGFRWFEQQISWNNLFFDLWALSFLDNLVGINWKYSRSQNSFPFLSRRNIF